MRTTALRPHLIWGVGDPHLVPRVLARAQAGRLRIVGTGQNRVDLVHVENAVDAHLLADQPFCASRFTLPPGHAYFITNGEPVLLWDWINNLLRALGRPPVTKKISLSPPRLWRLGAIFETAWKIPLPVQSDAP